MIKSIFKAAIFILIFSLQISASWAAKTKGVRCKIETNMGTMVVLLYDKTPLHKANFIKLTKEHYFDSLLFHRVIKGFMIQGGDPDSKHAKPKVMLGNGGPSYTIPAEFDTSIIHKKGVLAAARDGNPQKASSGSQFYIVQGKTYNDGELDAMEVRTGRKYSPAQRNLYKTIGGTPFLDMGYTVFGELISGFDVLDKIAAMPCDASDRPLGDVRILKVTVLRKKFLGIF